MWSLLFQDTTECDRKDTDTPPSCEQGDASSVSSLLGLPSDLLKRILQKLGLRQRLAASAAASTLRHAAGAATTVLAVQIASERQLGSLKLYLARNGMHVTSLQLSGAQGMGAALRQLPCPSLRSLELADLLLQVHPGICHVGVLHSAATGLTRLALSRCRVLLGAAGSMAVLAHFHMLADLHVHVADSSQVAVPGHVLSHLVRLTALHLDGVVSGDTLVHISRLSGLRHVSLGSSVNGGPATLQGLQGLQRLTRLSALSLSHVAAASPLGNSSGSVRRQLSSRANSGSGSDSNSSGGGNCSASTACLGLPPQLRRLRLSCCPSGLEPSLLAGLSQLVHLELRFTPMAHGASGVAELLAVLPGLQQLTHLVLSRSLRHLVPAARQSPGAAKATFTTHPQAAAATAVGAYSALTSSSALQLLDLAHCKLPRGVWQHMFRRGRWLPALRALDVSHVTDALAPPAPGSPCSRGHLGQRDVEGLLACCPGLQQLALEGATQESVWAMVAPHSCLSGWRVVSSGRYDDAGYTESSPPAYHQGPAVVLRRSTL